MFFLFCYESPIFSHMAFVLSDLRVFSRVDFYTRQCFPHGRSRYSVENENDHRLLGLLYTWVIMSSALVGYLHHRGNTMSEKTASMSLVFMAYPTALDLLPGSNFLRT